MSSNPGPTTPECGSGNRPALDKLLRGSHTIADLLCQRGTHLGESRGGFRRVAILVEGRLLVSSHFDHALRGGIALLREEDSVEPVHATELVEYDFAVDLLVMVPADEE